jgi:threonine/homoserine/homoserine lactone efflux protein
VIWSFAALVTNPKALSAYVVAIPTLSSTRLAGGGLFFAFAGVHIALMTLWLFAVDWAATRLPGAVTAGRTRRMVFAVASMGMVALGVSTVIHALRAQ